MEKTKLKLLDESGDRRYFTIIPNYILNHSTAIDQALYLQMKRYTGENGKCFATEQTLCKQLGIGRKALWKSLKYLAEHGWIKYVGLTGGKTRPIKTYKVNDIWRENIEHYKKIVSERDISINEDNTKDMSLLSGDSAQKEHKIVLKRDIEEELVEEEHIKKNQLAKAKENPESFGNKDINILVRYLEEAIKGSLDGTQQENRRYCYLLINRFKKDYPNRNPVEVTQFLISRGLEEKFHAKNITNFKYIYYNAMKILQSIKSDLNKNHITKIS